MKVIWPNILLCLVLLSCREVSFKEPQPAGISELKEIPASLQGHYLAYDGRTGDESDTLIIESLGYRFNDKQGTDWLGQGHLSDTLVLKFYKGFYFVNFKTGGQWVLRLIKQKPSKAIEFLSIDIGDEAKLKEMLRKLSKRFNVTTINVGEETFYQIEPTPVQLLELVEAGFFTGMELSKIK